MQHIKERQDTADFITIAVSWWKVLNVKGTGADIRFNDDLQAVVRDPNDDRLQNILNFGNMAIKMAEKQGKREKQLTCDTAQSFYHTCNSVELCRLLIQAIVVRIMVFYRMSHLLKYLMNYQILNLLFLLIIPVNG